MKKATYNYIKKSYNKECSKKDEITKLENMKSVQRYLALINSKRVCMPTDEDIMNRILNYADIDLEDSYGILYDKGPYVIYDEDSIFERRYLVTKENLHKLNHDPYREYYDLTTGKPSYKTDESTVILLPTLERIINGEEDYKLASYLIDDYACNLARANFFIRLVTNGTNETIDFYKDSKNYGVIEEEILRLRKGSK